MTKQRRARCVDVRLLRRYGSPTTCLDWRHATTRSDAFTKRRATRRRDVAAVPPGLPPVPAGVRSGKRRRTCRILAVARPVRSVRFLRRTSASGTDRIPTPGVSSGAVDSHINMQESALLLTLNLVAKNREKFLENYYAKNKMMIEQGRTKAPYALPSCPAKQRRQVEAAESDESDPPAKVPKCIPRRRRSRLMARKSPQATTIVRLDQPYGGVVETLLGVQCTRPRKPAAAT